MGENKYFCMTAVFHWGGTIWTTMLRKILWLDLRAGKWAEIYFHEEERGSDVSSDIGIYRKYRL